MAAASSGALDSAHAVTMELSACRGLEAPEAGLLICSAWGRSVLAVLGAPRLCLSGGRPDPGLCPGALCPGSALLDSSSAGQPPPRRAAPERLRAALGPAERAAVF